MIETIIRTSAVQAFKEIYSADLPPDDIILQKTRKDFEGDYTINVFPFLRISREKPEATAEKIGEYLITHCTSLSSYNIIKGFLNLVVKDGFWIRFLNESGNDQSIGIHATIEEKPYVIEYSSPNTNKPLHLGHIRNNLLGWSVAEILKAAGHNVEKVNLVNDRGIHICKSMLAWEKWFSGQTPESQNMKGDKLVGECYVRFDEELKKQVADMLSTGVEKEQAEREAPLMAEAREMLKSWESNDPSIRELWAEMNGWVYGGFD